MDQGNSAWRRNLAVCLLGSFTTIVAMTLLLPFLPIYVEQLGVSDPAAIAQWSGVAYGATFFKLRSQCIKSFAPSHAAFLRGRGFGKSIASSAFILASAASMIHMCELWRRSSNRRTEFSGMRSSFANFSFDHPFLRIVS